LNGQRAREVAHLTLDDIDWKRERLHVRIIINHQDELAGDVNGATLTIAVLQITMGAEPACAASMLPALRGQLRPSRLRL
jgi:hypothetical protein